MKALRERSTSSPLDTTTLPRPAIIGALAPMTKKGVEIGGGDKRLLSLRDVDLHSSVQANAIAQAVQKNRMFDSLDISRNPRLAAPDLAQILGAFGDECVHLLLRVGDLRAQPCVLRAQQRKVRLLPPRHNRQLSLRRLPLPPNHPQLL